MSQEKDLPSDGPLKKTSTPITPPPDLACQSTRHRPSQETGDAASQFPLPPPALAKVSQFQNCSQLRDKGWVGLGGGTWGVPACWPVTQSLPNHSLSKTASVEALIPWLPSKSLSLQSSPGEREEARKREPGTWLG